MENNNPFNTSLILSMAAKYGIDDLMLPAIRPLDRDIKNQFYRKVLELSFDKNKNYILTTKYVIPSEKSFFTRKHLLTDSTDKGCEIVRQLFQYDLLENIYNFKNYDKLR